MSLSGIWPSKEENRDYYWSLIIEKDWIQTGVWSIKDGVVEVISASSASAWGNDEELISSADSSLSACIQDFPEDADEPSKTVFGLPASWVKEGRITEEKIGKIKKICSDLSLEPVGFVVLSEAVSHFIKSKEGSPLSAVVLGIGREEIEISVFKIGVLAGYQEVSRSMSPCEDVVEGLSRFMQKEPFPSRMVLYDGREGELQEVKDQLMSATWDGNETVKFLHTPKVEILSPEDKVLAVSLAGGAELSKATKVEKISDTKGVEEVEDIGLDHVNLQEVKEKKAEDLGFAVGLDISKNPVQEPAPVPEQMEENVGFQSGQNQTKQAKVGLIGRISGMLNKIKIQIPKRRFKLPNFGGKIPLIAAVSLLVIFVSGFILWWYYPKAEVIVYLTPETLTDSSLITISSGGNFDIEQKTLPGEKIEEIFSGEEKISTTGTKTVGERSKGEITLYRAGSSVSLEAETEVVSDSGLRFTLDEDIDIASGSAGSPGTAKVAVTAVDIGTDYNLAANESFRVSNYPTSDIEAKNESALTGGTSREIRSVSSEDQENLENKLIEELEDQFSEKIGTEIEADRIFIQESLVSEVLKRDFDAKPGDEAENLELSLEIKVSGLIVEKKNLTEFARSLMEEKVPSGFVLRDDQISASFSFEESEEESVTVSTSFKANLLPEVNIDEIREKIAGKYPQIASDYLSAIPGFTRLEVKLDPPLPRRLAVIPRVKNNILVSVSSDR